MTEAELSVKGVLFDLDGTILDTTPAYLEAAKLTFQTIGQQIPEYTKMLEIPKRIERRLPIDDLTKMEPKTFLEAYIKNFYRVAASKTKPVPRVAETLELLSRKVQLAVITMRFMPKENVNAELRQHNLDRYFASIVTALDTIKPKPSPEALIKAVAAMDVQMCDCVIVGDSVIDVQAGKAAGAKTVAVLSGLYSRAELVEAQPNFIINDISELPKLLR
ncbi:MAG: HAD family hydrolase [Candidatus Bathyarchaeota archaeon]|nr:HAD family hydrolase [Candidatus Bathyarchaeota archaeon]